MRKLFNALISETAKAGYGEYRTHLGWMEAVNDTYNFNANVQRRLNEKLKDAIDSNGILAPGKQGGWPSVFRAAQNGEAALRGRGVPLLIYDSRIAAFARFVRGHMGKLIDVKGQDRAMWHQLRQQLPDGAIIGLTRWSDWVIVRGLMEDQGRRLVKEQRMGVVFRWEMA